MEVVFLENEDYTGEFVTLDTSVWVPVFQERGTDKGKNPVVSPNGTIYIGREYAGVEVRAFRKKVKKVSLDKENGSVSKEQMFNF